MGEKSKGGREAKKPKAGSVKPKLPGAAPQPEPETSRSKGIKKS